MFCEQIKKKLDQINKTLETLQTQVLSLPDGKLICGRSGKYYKWYRSDGHEKIYIPKKQQALAEKLALKKYLKAEIADLLSEKKALESYLKLHGSSANNVEELLCNNTEYQKLLEPYFQNETLNIERWKKEAFEQNKLYPEQLIHSTASGNYVRSKSEMLIDLYLYKNRIPFRYECALQLGEITIFPDFTILHPVTQQIYYWEHFGRMDDPKYIKNACSKLQLYALNGIIPSIQLITTYETRENPLSISTIDAIVSQYFL